MHPGTYARNHRPTCEAHLRLDVRHLARVGVLEQLRVTRWGWTTDEGRYEVLLQAQVGYVSVVYPPGRPPETPERQTLLLTSMPCHYGGIRWWWKCPACTRRNALLYFEPQGGFYCRRCLDLAYTSTRESDRDRLRYRITCLRNRLGVADDTMDGFSFPAKPPRMHDHTFIRLRDQLREAEGSYYAVLGTLFAVMKQRVAAVEADPMG